MYYSVSMKSTKVQTLGVCLHTYMYVYVHNAHAQHVQLMRILCVTESMQKIKWQRLRAVPLELTSLRYSK